MSPAQNLDSSAASRWTNSLTRSLRHVALDAPVAGYVASGLLFPLLVMNYLWKYLKEEAGVPLPWWFAHTGDVLWGVAFTTFWWMILRYRLGVAVALPILWAHDWTPPLSSFLSSRYGRFVVFLTGGSLIGAVLSAAPIARRHSAEVALILGSLTVAAIEIRNTAVGTADLMDIPVGLFSAIAIYMIALRPERSIGWREPVLRVAFGLGVAAAPVLYNVAMAPEKYLSMAREAGATTMMLSVALMDPVGYIARVFGVLVVVEAARFVWTREYRFLELLLSSLGSFVLLLFGGEKCLMLVKQPSAFGLIECSVLMLGAITSFIVGFAEGELLRTRRRDADVVRAQRFEIWGGLGVAAACVFVLGYRWNNESFLSIRSSIGFLAASLTVLLGASVLQVANNSRRVRITGYICIAGGSLFFLTLMAYGR